MQMASGGSIFDSLLEIVDSISLTQDSDDITFTFDNSQGTYFVLSNPPGTREVAYDSSMPQTINAIAFVVGDSGTTPRGQITITYRKTPTQTLDIDWWASTISIIEGAVTITSARNTQYKFLKDTTYYLARVKGA